MLKPEIGKYYKSKSQGLFIIKPIRKVKGGFTVLIVEGKWGKGTQSFWGPPAFTEYEELTELEQALL